MSATASQPLPSIRTIRGPGRVAYAGLAAALLASAVALIVVWAATWSQTAAFALGPDLAVLAGIAPGLARGQPHPRAVALHDALRRFWEPLGLMTVAVIAGLPAGWMAGALAWAFHVAFDRAIGLRLRSPNGLSAS